jgi:hypothetical protein
MTSPNTTLVKAPPLPLSRENWIRATKLGRTINDYVEEIHFLLITKPEYIELLDAIYDAQAVEGSKKADDLFAAKMIRDKAKSLDGNHALVKENATSIAKALRVVLKRFGQGREQRRDRVATQTVPDDGATDGAENN